MFRLSDYHYDLPDEMIAQQPCEDRSKSRLMHLNRATGQTEHGYFSQIASILRPGDLLVVNNTRVVPARLYGKKETGGKVEILIIDYATGIKNLETTGCFECDCLVKASKRPGEGSELFLANGVKAQVTGSQDSITQIRFLNSDRFPQFLQEYGKLPLPPYIKRDDKISGIHDPENYQTVYADQEGAVAAPTAGLHFTGELLEKIKTRGIDIAPITLHVGYGTFVPVRVDDIRDHQIHSEYFSLSDQTARKINAAKKEGRRVVAVGTTSVRTLEYVSNDQGRVEPGEGVCDLFIYPGYEFRCVDAMITNFHLPESTLLMLVSAFYTREKMLKAYRDAINEKYRFFSYGDAMFIE